MHEWDGVSFGWCFKAKLLELNVCQSVDPLTERAGEQEEAMTLTLAQFLGLLFAALALACFSAIAFFRP